MTVMFRVKINDDNQSKAHCDLCFVKIPRGGTTASFSNASNLMKPEKTNLSKNIDRLH